MATSDLDERIARVLGKNPASPAPSTPTRGAGGGSDLDERIARVLGRPPASEVQSASKNSASLDERIAAALGQAGAATPQARTAGGGGGDLEARVAAVLGSSGASRGSGPPSTPGGESLEERIQRALGRTPTPASNGAASGNAQDGSLDERIARILNRDGGGTGGGVPASPARALNFSASGNGAAGGGGSGDKGVSLEERIGRVLGRTTPTGGGVVAPASANDSLDERIRRVLAGGAGATAATAATAPPPPTAAAKQGPPPRTLVLEVRAATFKGGLSTGATSRREIPVESHIPFHNLADMPLVERKGRGTAWQTEKRTTANGNAVAAKILSGALDGSVEDFVKEVGTLAGLRHPAVARCLGVCAAYGSDGVTSQIGVVYEFSDAGTLGDFLRKGGGATPLDQKARVLADVASALHYLHGKGHTHGGVRPDNVLLPSGDAAAGGGGRRGVLSPARLADMAFTGAPSPATRPRAARYMPPEVATGGAAKSVAADVYALGALACEILCGRAPPPPSAPALAAAAAARSPAAQSIKPDPAAAALPDPLTGMQMPEGVPARVVEAVRACLAPAAAARPAASAAATALRQWVMEIDRK